MSKSLDPKNRERLEKPFEPDVKKGKNPSPPPAKPQPPTPPPKKS